MAREASAMWATCTQEHSSSFGNDTLPTPIIKAVTPSSRLTGQAIRMASFLLPDLAFCPLRPIGKVVLNEQSPSCENWMLHLSAEDIGTRFNISNTFPHPTT